MRIYVPQTRRIDRDVEQMLIRDGYDDIVYSSRNDTLKEHMITTLGCDAMLVDATEEHTKIWKDFRNMAAICGVEIVDVSSLNSESTIAEIVAQYYNVSVVSMKRKGRYRDITDARKMTAYIMRDAGVPVRRISQFLHKERAVINYYIKSCRDYLRYDKKVKADYKAIKLIIENSETK